MFGGFGKSGMGGFIVPMLIIWIGGSILFSAIGSTTSRKFEPRQRIYPKREIRVVRPSERPAVKPVAKAVATPAPQPQVRSLAGVPSTCKACGGPANETTVQWRGSKPYCGFCGTGF